MSEPVEIADEAPVDYDEAFKTNPAFVEHLDWAARWTERHPDVAPKE